MSTIPDLGIRNGEARAARSTGLQPLSITATREKTRGKPSTITRKMSRLPRRHLDSYPSARGGGHPPLFVTKERLGRGEPRRIAGGGARHVVDKNRGTAREKKYGPHVLRHARPSQLAWDGRPIKLIAESLDITAQTGSTAT